MSHGGKVVALPLYRMMACLMNEAKLFSEGSTDLVCRWSRERVTCHRHRSWLSQFFSMKTELKGVDRQHTRSIMCGACRTGEPCVTLVNGAGATWIRPGVGAPLTARDA